ncbi:single-stranded DNA-binding protein [Anaerorhabdus furcosa]|uniref:Single-stranded DNA-binding protein n=1 Tax=Anaerorhabdus furcosa TaxID=118967 RepID=A0A1T4K5I1_9FIRM|nr:single-stranded DNA-binding protein [Anaerorhabdus furcosa]SJZ37694.1 single-strand DNA-binding protein [Anaerorhabdus furcosa]
MINRVVLVGRLTKDVEIKKTSSGLSVASFTVACNRRVSGQGQEKQADFINCVAWRQTADFLGQYARKGALVGVEGRIQTRNYDGTDGKKVYVTEVVCDSCQLLESKSTSENRPASTSFDGPSYSGMEASGFEADNAFDDFNAGPSLDISSDDLPF